MNYDPPVIFPLLRPIRPIESAAQARRMRRVTYRLGVVAWRHRDGCPFAKTGECSDPCYGQRYSAGYRSEIIREEIHRWLQREGRIFGTTADLPYRWARLTF